MNEALAGVRAEAAMMRSPSFSREGESSTITNSSFAGGGGLLAAYSTGYKTVVRA